MILIKPDFYDKFKCTASRCSDTCCVGWEIDVDKPSQEAYRKVAGAFGDRLRENIVDGHFKLLPQNRCPFLDKENLCEIYQQLGEGALCDICREHPRFVEVYGDIMEKGLGLCCEEATRLLLEGEGPLQLIAEESDEPEDELDEDDEEIRNEVLYEREQIFKFLANDSLSLSEKLYNAFGCSSEQPFAPLENAEAYLELLEKTVSFGPAWDEALARIQLRIKAPLKPNRRAATVADQGFFSENESARLLAYLTYRHYAKCLFEGFEQGKRLFAVFFWNVARFFTRELAGTLDANPADEAQSKQVKIDAIKILSRQLEYAEENMVLLERALEGGEE